MTIGLALNVNAPTSYEPNITGGGWFGISIGILVFIVGVIGTICYCKGKGQKSEIKNKDKLLNEKGNEIGEDEFEIEKNRLGGTESSNLRIAHRTTIMTEESNPSQEGLI